MELFLKNIDSTRKSSRIMLFQKLHSIFVETSMTIQISRSIFFRFTSTWFPFFFSHQQQNHTFWWRNIFLCILSAIRYFQQRGVRSSKFQSAQQRRVTATRKIYWCTNARSIENQRALVAQKLCFSRARSEREMDIPR